MTPMTNRTKSIAFAVAALMLTWGGTRAAHAALTNAQMVDLLKQVDERQRNNGDWRANAYMEQKE